MSPRIDIRLRPNKEAPASARRALDQLRDKLPQHVLEDVRLLLDGPLSHPVTASYEVDQPGEERDEDQEEDPDRLPPPGELVVSKQIAHDRDENPEPDHQQEDL